MELAVTSQKVEAFLEEAIAASCEGLMAKALVEDSTYRASKRSDSWLKIKRDYVEGLHDTLDLVLIGAWNGNWRKAGWLDLVYNILSQTATTHIWNKE
ncbi:hypothetical protein O6H91_14G022300 [Diphasiastrum complanatum]|uniref:Uncharacterized protein n=1 Tax=Diphasiastrum complanatum TaxID=34168 RepID=A0ACC2BM75_DIPCM|nr:hypothetical protein O6H91_14G022300 [Diphasiastrum complanatum]